MANQVAIIEKGWGGLRSKIKSLAEMFGYNIVIDLAVKSYYGVGSLPFIHFLSRLCIMAFNAKWQLESLANSLGISLMELLINFKKDLEEMIKICQVFKLSIKKSGNCFILLNKHNSEYQPPNEAGLYTIFNPQHVIYYGEAKDLYRRQLVDPDNTADSTKSFSNQGRAILKLIMHNAWSGKLELDPLYMQLLPGTTELTQQNHRTFEDCYRVSEYSKALEGAMGLFIHNYHSLMVGRLKKDGFVA